MKRNLQHEIEGLIVPVLTPFTDNGSLDRDAFIRHLVFLEEHGVRRIMVSGTTAEFFSLLSQERKTLLETARAHFGGLIVAHLGGLGLEQNRLESHWAGDLGADAIAALPPIYPAGLPDENIIAYYIALAETAVLPLILYNFPKHAGNTITPAVLKAVPHYALKDSAQNLTLIEHTPRYLVGSSSSIYGPVQQGAAGFVSATANVRPELYTAMEQLVVAAKVEEAAVMEEEIRAYSAQFSSGGVPALKQALARKLPGYPVTVRCPLLQSDI